ncbi:MAG: rhodanese-like domain-containing protein [Epsilonproteobacteria bacterium]|nr:MAG: rhodanese-like domain-containing protein [Campylobacterota bacterium]
MKNYTNIFYWIAMIALLVWFAYSKGWILANFKSISAEQAYNLVMNDKNVTLLDVRTIDEFNSHHVKDAQLIPLGVLEKNLAKIQAIKDKSILVYCQTGRRSVSASRILENNGFIPINIDGGIIAMKHVGFNIIK